MALSLTKNGDGYCVYSIDITSLVQRKEEAHPPESLFLMFLVTNVCILFISQVKFR